MLNGAGELSGGRVYKAGAGEGGSNPKGAGGAAGGRRQRRRRQQVGNDSMLI